MADKPKKGVAGMGTGSAARAAIDAAQARGATNEEIGRATGRSASTIGQIDRGEIANPPGDIAAKARKTKVSKKKK